MIYIGYDTYVVYDRSHVPRREYVCNCFIPTSCKSILMVRSMLDAIFLWYTPGCRSVSVYSGIHNLWAGVLMRLPKTWGSRKGWGGQCAVCLRHIGRGAVAWGWTNQFCGEVRVEFVASNYGWWKNGSDRRGISVYRNKLCMHRDTNLGSIIYCLFVMNEWRWGMMGNCLGRWWSPWDKPEHHGYLIPWVTDNQERWQVGTVYILLWWTARTWHWVMHSEEGWHWLYTYLYSGVGVE